MISLVTGSGDVAVTFADDGVEVPTEHRVTTADNRSDEAEGAHRYWALVLLVIPALTVFGNVLVVLSVVKEKSLRSITNYFIVSLAIADIMVAILVMPLAVYVEVNNAVWGLGDALCDTWVAFDVMCCTASILNLTAISIDRFIAVTRPLQYAKHRFSKRVHVTLTLTWIVSAVVSSPIVLGWNYTERRQLTPNICTFYNAEFLIYSSMASFYIPCIAMILLYCKTLRVILNRAAARVRQRRRNNCGVVAAPLVGGKPEVMVIRDENVNGDMSRVRCEQKLRRENIGARGASAETARRTVSGFDELTLSAAEEFDFERGHFRSWLFRSAARRILLRVFPGHSRWLTPRSARNSRTPATATFQLSLLNQRNREPAETIITRVSQPEVEEDAAIVIDTTDCETHPLTGQIHYLTTTDCTESEQPEMNVGIVNDNGAGSSGRSHHVVEKRLAIAVKTKPETGVFLTAPALRPSKLGGLRKNFQPAPPRCRQLIVTTNAGNAVRETVVGGGKHRTPSSGREKQCGSKERKATKTLAIVLGVFLLCWVPFFTLNIINAICIRYDLFTESAVCNIHPMAFSLFVWLGYINSFLNPVIYTIFNVEFRKAFKKLLQHPCV